MKDGKRGFFVLLAVFLVLAMTQRFITTEDLIVRMFSLISTYIVIVGTILYGVGIWTRNKIMNFVGMGIIIIGYVYSIFLIISKYPKFSPELGFMIYLLAFVAFIVSIVMPDTIKLQINEEEAETVVDTNKEDNKVIDRTNDVIFGTYISGIPKRPELSKKVCLLGYDDDKFLLYITNGSNVENFKISYGIVDSITSRQRVVMEQKDVNNEDDTQDRQTLANEVVGVFGNSVATAIANDIKKTGESVAYNDLYELNLNFKVLDDSKRLIININSDPTDFINKFNTVDKSNTTPFEVSETENLEEEVNDTPPNIDVTQLAQTEEINKAINEESNNNNNLLEDEDNQDEELI